jgi:hypothetical protein
MSAEAYLVDVANAMQIAVANHDFGIAFNSEMSYADATKKLEEYTGKLNIDFVPWRSLPSFTAKRVLQYECSVDVVARKKFNPKGDQELSTGRTSKEEINRLIKLVQDVDEFFLLDAAAKELTLPTIGGWKATVQSSDKKQDYSRLHLYTADQFTGWVRVTYLASKEV